jgi:hypothetical protein
VGAWVGGAVVAGGVVVVADVGVVVAAVVGGWIAGSDFSPQPVPAPASPAVTSMSGSSVRRPRMELTAGHANELD